MSEELGVGLWKGSAMVPVLLVTGPIGAGKSAVVHEADVLLIEARARHASVELEEIARCWPEEIASRSSLFVYPNLAALWSNFAAAGASRLLLAGLLERRSDVHGIQDAIPDAVVTVVRLHAPLSLLEQRIRLREPGSSDGELDAARWWTRHYQSEQPEDYVVEADHRPVREIAREVLRRAGWLS